MRPLRLFCLALLTTPCALRHAAAQAPLPARLRVQGLALGESPFLQERYEIQLTSGLRREGGGTILPVEVEFGFASQWQASFLLEGASGIWPGRRAIAVARGFKPSVDGRSRFFTGIEAGTAVGDGSEFEALVGGSVAPAKLRGIQLVGQLRAVQSRGSGAPPTTTLGWHAGAMVPFTRLAIGAELASDTERGGPSRALGVWGDPVDGVQVGLLLPWHAGDRTPWRSASITLSLEFP